MEAEGQRRAGSFFPSSNQAISEETLQPRTCVPTDSPSFLFCCEPRASPPSTLGGQAAKGRHRGPFKLRATVHSPRARCRCVERQVQRPRIVRPSQDSWCLRAAVPVMGTGHDHVRQQGDPKAAPAAYSSSF